MRVRDEITAGIECMSKKSRKKAGGAKKKEETLKRGRFN